MKFSDRKWLAESFERWAEKNCATRSAFSVITWLDIIWELAKPADNENGREELAEMERWKKMKAAIEAGRTKNGGNRMTTRTDRIVTEHTVYIAEDGKEFSNEKDCRYYESQLVYNMACEAYSKLKQFDCRPPFCEDNDAEWTWIRLTCKEDLDAAKTALYCDDCTAMDYEVDTYPCWVAFAHNGDGYGDVIGTISDVREEMMMYIISVFGKQHEEASYPDV